MKSYSLRWGGDHHPSQDPAITGNDGASTAADLLGRALAIDAHLPPRAVGRLVAVSCRDRLDFVVAALACWRRGFTVVLPPAGDSAVAEILADPRVIAHVHDGGYDTGLDVRRWQTSRSSTGDCDPDAWGRMDAREPMVVLHSSGTTGEPVQVTKTAGQLWGEAAVLARHFSVGVEDCILAVVPHHHIYGLLFGILLPWSSGARLVRETPLHAPTLEEAVAGHRVTRLVSTPAHLRSLAVLESTSHLNGLRTVFSSGAPIGPDVIRTMAARAREPVTEILGSTETGGIAWRRPTVDCPSPWWQPLPGVTVEADAEGRMILESPFLGASDPRPCLGQDRVRLGTNGTFEHLGRLDDIVKVGGKRLSLIGLEARLRQLDGVADAAVLSEPSPDGRGHRVRAAVVAPTRDPAALRRELLQWFDPSVLPRSILCVPVLPREDSGKIRKDRLRRLWLAGADEGRDFDFGPIEQVDSSRCEIDIVVPDDLVYFSGHFPGHPILPGVAQLEGIILSQTQRCWPALGRARRVVRLKFRETIRPGERLRLRLARDEVRARVMFELSRSGQLCSTGILEFPEPGVVS